ncbi:MAG: class I SAM-dependent DNA methyltransferase, partial [Desulfonatronovibrionaceae bacterium]
AEDYDRDLQSWRYQAPDRAADILTRHLGPDAAILDAGCGTGLTAKALAAAGFKVIDGMDLSEKSLQTARKYGVYRSLKQVNLQELPLPAEDNAYQGLECIGVLTYVPESKDLLREFCRVVRSGGTIVLTQRNDIFEERDFRATVNEIASEGRWEVLDISEPKPYLPEHEEYADEIMIHYITCRVL